MAPHPRAGQPPAPADLVDLAHLVTAYYTIRPDADDPAQAVAFGTSGHRGSALAGAFNEAHIAAITQAIAEHRRAAGVDGPLFLGRDTHGLSEPAWVTALEVLAGNDVTVVIDAAGRYTPTPAISHAILTHNRRGGPHPADGIVVTPSHNPPADGGFKYNPPHGGPADSAVTGAIAARANEILRAGNTAVRRVAPAAALAAAHRHDYLDGYVADLPNVIDLAAIAAAGLPIAADPLGGASVDYWAVIAERHGLNLTVLNPVVDATWRFMTLDTDGQIRMDCSSPDAMAGLLGALAADPGRYRIVTGNDPDADRHGIICADGGLLAPNHYLAVAIDYLFGHRPAWPAGAAVGKTAVSSSIIDRVAAGLGRTLLEVPVGFKWFVAGLYDGTLGFGGEESAGASFLRRDGHVWTTDKDGIILALLAAEIEAVTGASPARHYRRLTDRYGDPAYARRSAPAGAELKARLAGLTAGQVDAVELAGQPITAKHTTAPGNGAALGGLKISTADAWFAARPSGTEDVYKIYAESFRGPDHLARVLDEAQQLVDALTG